MRRVGRSVEQVACIRSRREPARWPLALAVLVLTTGSDPARGTPLTEETRAGFIKSAEQSCFEGQSKQEANKSRKPEVLRRFCACFADRMSYTMTMESALASLGKSPSAEEERVMNAILENCWQVHVTK